MEQKHPLGLQPLHHPAPAHQQIAYHLHYILLVPIQQHHTTRKRSRKSYKDICMDLEILMHKICPRLCSAQTCWENAAASIAAAARLLDWDDPDGPDPGPRMLFAYATRKICPFFSRVVPFVASRALVASSTWKTRKHKENQYCSPNIHMFQQTTK